MTRGWGDSFRNLAGPMANSPGNCAWGCYVFLGKRHEKAELSCQAFHLVLSLFGYGLLVKRRGPSIRLPRDSGHVTLHRRGWVDMDSHLSSVPTFGLQNQILPALSSALTK